MVKRFTVFSGWVFLGLALLAGVGCSSGCSTARPASTAGADTADSTGRDPADVANARAKAKRDAEPPLWRVRAPGLISDLNVARKAPLVLISTVPNFEDPAGSRRNLLSMLDSGGKIRWSLAMATSVKHQVISDDGAFVVAVTHDDQVFGIQGGVDGGRILWTREGNCRPDLLEEARRVVCFHDDDPKAEIGFEVFDWDGKDVLSLPVTQDAILYRVSFDRKTSVLGLSRGQLLFLGADLRARWQVKLPGELIDVDLSLGDAPLTLVVFQAVGKGGKQILALLDADGKVRAQSEVTGRRISQVRLEASGERGWLYGQGAEGQWIGSFRRNEFSLIQASLERSVLTAHYASSVALASGRAAIVLDDSRVLVLDGEGKVRSEFWPEEPEGVLLYLHDFGNDGALLVTASDQGHLTAFQVRK